MDNWLPIQPPAPFALTAAGGAIPGVMDEWLAEATAANAINPEQRRRQYGPQAAALHEVLSLLERVLLVARGTMMGNSHTREQHADLQNSARYVMGFVQERDISHRLWRLMGGEAGGWPPRCFGTRFYQFDDLWDSYRRAMFWIVDADFAEGPVWGSDKDAAVLAPLLEKIRQIMKGTRNIPREYRGILVMSDRDTLAEPRTIGLEDLLPRRYAPPQMMHAFLHAPNPNIW